MSPLSTSRDAPGAASTELEPSISGVPWRGDFAWWAGIDAVTGECRDAALIPALVHEAAPGSSSEHYTIIGTDNDLAQEMVRLIGERYHIAGVEGTHLSRPLFHVAYGAATLSIIARFGRMNGGYDEPAGGSWLRLSDEARELARDPARFRERFGDYFICGSRRGRQFAAVYTCRAATSSRLQRFAASLDSQSLGLFSESGSMAFEEVAACNGIAISVSSDMTTVEASLPSRPARKPSDIPTQLDWFKRHAQAVPMQARLLHYHGVEPRIPLLAPVAPSLFSELHALYRTVWEVRTWYRSCPAESQRDLAGPYDDFDIGVTASRGKLAYEPALRRAYARRAAFLKRYLRNVVRRDAEREAPTSQGGEILFGGTRGTVLSRMALPR